MVDDEARTGVKNIEKYMISDYYSQLLSERKRAYAMPPAQITIATRESPLAWQQAQWVKTQLLQLQPQLKINLLGIKTVGDKILNTALELIGGKGLFVKELEEAILAGRADFAVHSMKDVPMTLPAGLEIAVMPAREAVSDVFISNDYRTLQEVPAGSFIGTSSPRRHAQIKAFFPQLTVKLLRGNINTRLNK